MATTPRLTCPTEHTDPDTGKQVLVGSHASRYTLARLLAGQCPACPAESLTPRSTVLYGDTRRVGHCGCCEAVWLLDDPDHWTAVELGRLVSVPHETGGQRKQRRLRNMGDQLTSEDAATLVGVTGSTWRAYVARGQAPAPLPGYDPQTGRRVWDRATVETWLADRPGPGNWSTSTRRR